MLGAFVQHLQQWILSTLKFTCKNNRNFHINLLVVCLTFCSAISSLAYRSGAEADEAFPVPGKKVIYVVALGESLVYYL